MTDPTNPLMRGTYEFPAPTTPVRIPTTPDGVDTVIGHPDSSTPPARSAGRLSLRAVIDDALATSPTDHIVTVAAANELVDHIERAIIDASGGDKHIVRVKGYSWTIAHPITERFENDVHHGLFDCRYTALVAEADFEEDGTFRVWLDRGALLWEPTTRG